MGIGKKTNVTYMAIYKQWLIKSKNIKGEGSGFILQPLAETFLNKLLKKNTNNKRIH